MGCWGGSDIKTGKEQRLVGTVKDAWTTAAHQNSFSETGMKYPPTAKSLSNMSKVQLHLLEIGFKIRSFFHTRLLLHLILPSSKIKSINTVRVMFLPTNASQIAESLLMFFLFVVCVKKGGKKT